MSTQTPTPKDPSTAMLIEIIGGYLGFMGMGHFYAGRTGEGVMRLFGWWITVALAIVVLLVVAGAGIVAGASSGTEEGLFAGLLGGSFLSLCLSLLLIVGVLAAPIISGSQLKKKMRP